VKRIALQFSRSFLYDAEDEADLMPSLTLLQATTHQIRLSEIDKVIIARYFVTVLAVGFCFRAQTNRSSIELIG
jgi:hypothetical protein